MKKIRMLAVVAAFLFMAVGPAAFPARAIVSNDRCFPLDRDRGTIEIDEDGVPHQCVCYPSPVRPGQETCRWQPISGFQKSTQLTEWGVNNTHQNYAEIGTTPNGYFRSRGALQNYYAGSASNMPPGYMANATVVYQWNGTVPGGRWDKCKDSGFYYNGVTTYAITQTWRFTTPPCGSNWYMTQSYGFVFSNGAWQGSPYGISSGFVGWNGCASCRTTMNASAGSPPPKNAPLPKYDAPNGLPPDGALLRTINQVIPGLTVAVS